MHTILPHMILSKFECLNLCQLKPREWHRRKNHGAINMITMYVERSTILLVLPTLKIFHKQT